MYEFVCLYLCVSSFCFFFLQWYFLHVPQSEYTHKNQYEIPHPYFSKMLFSLFRIDKFIIHRHSFNHHPTEVPQDVGASIEDVCLSVCLSVSCHAGIGSQRRITCSLDYGSPLAKLDMPGIWAWSRVKHTRSMPPHARFAKNLQ